MHTTIQAVAEAFIIAATLSLDSFAGSFAYGTSKIKIPFRSALTIAFVCSAALGFTLFLGGVIRPYIDAAAVKYISFAVLLAIGAFKLLEEVIKMLLKKKADKELAFNIFNFRLILKVFQSETEADINKDKVLSAAEAATLAAALSIDGLAVGFSAGLAQVNALFLILFSFLTGFAAVISGRKAGEKIASKIKINLSWLSGLILVAIAVLKLF